MGKIEAEIIEAIQKYILKFGFAAISVLALTLRLACLDIQSFDCIDFLNPWLADLDRFSGLSGIGHNIGEYNVPYMLFLNIVTKTPFTDIYEIKALSILFDYICALVIIRIAFDKKERMSLKGLIVYTVAMMSPISFLNSAYWAQCDGIYTAFILISLYCLVREKYPGTMIAFGFAFAFKLQAVFFLPVLVIYYFATKKMSIKYILAVPIVYFLSILPAIIAGRDIMETLTIYTRQADLYSKLTLQCPNIYYILDGNYVMLKKMGMVLTMAILGIAACYFIYNKITSRNAYILLALWCSMVCVYFLPGMHERYSYMACFIAIVYAVRNKKDWWLALGFNLVTLLSWVPYLFGFELVKLEYLSIANLLLLVVLTLRLFTVKNDIADETSTAVSA